MYCSALCEMVGWEKVSLIEHTQKGEATSIDIAQCCTILKMIVVGLSLGCIFVAVRVAMGIKAL